MRNLLRPLVILVCVIVCGSRALAQTPQIIATLADTLQVDNGVPGQVNEGDVIRYKGKIQNTGTGAASNVQATFPTPPPNTTMVAGSIKTSALARDDNYTAAYNTNYNGASVLSNDFGIPMPTAVISYGPSANPAATSVGGAGITDAGGSVVVNADGTFSYSPPTNFTGTDHFKYITGNGNLPDNDAVVTLSVGAKLNTDNYTVTGNTQFVAGGYTAPSTPSTSDPSGVLANDASGQPITTVVVSNAATQNGGTISINSDGSFLYTPPRNFTGTDTYIYSAQSGGITSTGTINFSVSNIVWYVDNSYAGANGAADGTSSRPYGDVATAESASSPSQAIYISTGSGNTNGAATLKAGQFLGGAGAYFTYGTLAISGSTAPVLTGTVTLANNVYVTGFDMNTGSNAALLATNASTTYVNIGNITVTGAANAVSLTNTSGNISIAGGTVSNTTGASFNVSGGTVNFGYSGDITQTLNAPVVNVASHATGTIVFAGNINATNGTGLQYSGDSGNYNFFGTTNLNGGDAGIDIINSGGTFNFGTGTTVSSPTNGAFFLSGTAAVTYDGGIFETNSAPAITIQNHSTGTVTFETGNINVFGGSGFAFTNCSSTYYFNGTTSFISASLSGIAITNSSGTFNFSSGTNISGGATVPRLLVSGGTATVNYNGSIAQTANAALVSVSAHSTGTLTFLLGTLNASNGTGLQFDNADGIYSFGGATTLNGGDAGIDILNGSAGTFTFGSGTAITDPSGEAIKINFSSANVTYSGSFSKTNAGIAAGILVNAETSGTIAINGSTKTITTTTANAVNLTSNTGATINFSNGNLLLTTTSGTGFNATGGGTVSVTGTGNTIASPTGTALNVNATNIGVSGLTFKSISSASSAGPNGINLVSTGNFAGLTVSGVSGTPGSGGTIANKTGADGSTTQGSGVYMSNTSSVSLSYMDIEGCANYGIRGLSVNNFILANCTVGQTAVNGTSISTDIETNAAYTFAGEGSLRFTNLTGTCSFINCTLDKGYARTLAIRNDNAGSTLNLTVSNCTINETLTTVATDAFFMVGTTTATMNLTVTGPSTFSSYRQNAIDVLAYNQTTMNVILTGNNFSNSNTGVAAGAGALNLRGVGSTAGDDVYVKFDIEGNSFRHGTASVTAATTGGPQFICGMAAGTGKFDGKFISNTVGVTGVANSGSGSVAGNAYDAIQMYAVGNAGTNRISLTTHSRFLVKGNTIKDYGNAGVTLTTYQGNSILDGTILGNTVSEPGSTAFTGVLINNGNSVADANQLNVAIGGSVSTDKNTLQGSDPTNVSDISIYNQASGSLTLFRNGSSQTVVKQILADDNNPLLDLNDLNGTIGVSLGLPSQVP